MDDTTLGASCPDMWLHKSAISPSAMPGDSVIFNLSYGNQCGAPAASVRVSNSMNTARVSMVTGELEGWNNTVQERIFAGQLLYMPIIQWR